MVVPNIKHVILDAAHDFIASAETLEAASEIAQREATARNEIISVIFTDEKGLMDSVPYFPPGHPEGQLFDVVDEAGTVLMAGLRRLDFWPTLGRVSQERCGTSIFVRAQ